MLARHVGGPAEREAGNTVAPRASTSGIGRMPVHRPSACGIEAWPSHLGRKRAPPTEVMSLKKRLLRILLSLLVVFLFAGYFAFSTFLFSPLERDFANDIAALIPRDVDFYGAKGSIEDLFDPFPRLAVMDEVEATEAWRTFADSPEYGDLERDLGLAAVLEEVRRNLDQIPFGFGDAPQEIFGGRDLAFAGYFRGRDFAQSDWAVYGRANWLGKLAVSALAYPGLLGLDAQGLTLTEEAECITISGGQLVRPIHVTRIRDVIIAGTSRELVLGALELRDRAGEDSLLLSARYFDHIEWVREDADELELFVDVRAMLKNLSLQGPYPDPKSEFFTEALLGRLFQAPACREIIGVVNFEDGIEVNLYGELSSELITSAQNKIYKHAGFSADELRRDIARMAPADTVLFVYLHGPVAELLRQVIASLEPAFRSNLDDAFRSTGKYGKLDDLIDDLDRSLKNRLALIVRENDYPLEMELDPATGAEVYVGPPNDGEPVFAVALIAWIKDDKPLEALRELIGGNSAKFGIQGREPGQNGYFLNFVAGFETREFWSPFIKGTGVIATLNTNEHLVVTNAIPMLAHVLKTHSQGGTKYPRLTSRVDFTALVKSSLASANLFVWLAPREANKTLELSARRWAEDNATASIDWRTLRAQQEAKAIPELFAGKRRAQLTKDEKLELDAYVDPILAQIRVDTQAEQVPILMARKAREITYSGAVSAAVAMLKLKPRSFQLSIRVVTPLDQ